MTTRRLRHLTDLYTLGVVVPMRDGSPVWMQVLNPFEQDTARSEATVAKARMTFAIKEHGGDEQQKARLFFFDGGREAAIENLIEAKVTANMVKVVEGVRNDPEWKERMDILDRGLEDTAKPPEEAEKELFHKLSVDYLAEIGKRMESERGFFRQQYAEATEEVLWDEYLEWYIDRRSNEVSAAEFRLHQLYFGARDCKAVRDEAGFWDHAACDGHQVLLFPTKEDARNAPEELQAELLEALDNVDMTTREAKNWDRQGSSFDSSPLPSAPAESTVSTQDETRDEPPGISAQPSPTPSPSLASTS
jgi:hypothetical protein